MSRRKRRRKEREAEQRQSLKHKRSILRYLRIAPRKVRAVANTVRGRRVEQALAILAGHGQGFLVVHVLARLQGGDADVGVGMGNGEVEDYVDVGVIE